jgi:hypothetical protein
LKKIFITFRGSGISRERNDFEREEGHCPVARIYITFRGSGVSRERNDCKREEGLCPVARIYCLC